MHYTTLEFEISKKQALLRAERTPPKSMTKTDENNEKHWKRRDICEMKISSFSSFKNTI
jgi:hypothetical protein